MNDSNMIEACVDFLKKVNFLEDTNHSLELSLSLLKPEGYALLPSQESIIRLIL